jgi:hypothetical protein
LSEGEVQTLLKAASKLAQQLDAEKMKWSDPFAIAIRAGVANLRGDNQNAIKLLTSAATSFDFAEMHLYAAATRRRLGQLTGGDEGRRMIEAADEWMRAQKIMRPDLMTRTLVPGFADDDVASLNG